MKLPAALLPVLDWQRFRVAALRHAAGDRWQEHDLVCPSTIGTPMHGSNVPSRFQKLLAVAGLPHLRFRDLRHAAAAVLIANKVHPKDIQEILGHTLLSTTMDIYGHLFPGATHDAKELIATRMSRGIDDTDFGPDREGVGIKLGVKRENGTQ